MTQSSCIERSAALPGNGKTARSPIKNMLAAGMALLVVSFTGTAMAADMPPATFADLAAKVTPAVVNISSTQHVAGTANSAMPFDFPKGSPFEQFFKHFQEGQGNPGEELTALGSGFIIDSSGYVVTNNHVIENSTDITVTLTTGKQYPAKIVGTDKKTDLALLKIHAPEPLPYVSFGDSADARVGDWVLAVGNPFGLGGTVTTGIISARGRDIHSGPYDDFLQIDASINRGNSGGPTFNLAGQVIGINTAIASPNGGSVGIGFAIPSEMAKPVIEALRKQGHVDRGWIGVEIQQVTPAIASSLGLDEAKGALVASVQPNGPALAGHVEQGDVILSFDGHVVHETRDLPLIVADTPAGKKVDVVVWRDGGKKTLTLTVAPMKESKEVASAGQQSAPSTQGAAERVLGVQLATLTSDMRQQLGLSDDVKGVVVTDVTSDGPAAQEGLRQGDVIEQVQRRKVTTPAQVDRLVTKAASESKKAVLLLVNRGGNEVYMAVKVGKA